MTSLCHIETTDETGQVAAADQWAELLANALAHVGVTPPAEASLTFVAADRMADLNAEHMGSAGPTDVLSFPIDDDPADVGVSGVRFVGDIVICPEVAERNAPDHAGSVDDEYALLVVHGALHLVGHDHGNPDDRDRMWATEQQVLAAHWRPLPTTAWDPQ